MLKKIILGLGLMLGLSTAFAAAGYCTPSTIGGPSDRYIARVLLTGSNGTLDNTSVASASSPNYYDYFSSAFVPTLVSGDQYTVTIQVGPHPLTDHQNVAVWIDLDGDQTFSSGEKIGETDDMDADEFTSFIFTGTSTAARLRVMLFHISTDFSPCYSGVNAGETEDYDINVRYAAPLVGGGKRYIPPVDNCPEGDMSPTQYDGLCSGMSSSNGTLAMSGNITTSGSVTTTGSVTSTGTVATDDSGTGSVTEEEPAHQEEPSLWTDADVCPDAEMEEAYMYAHAHGITTMDTCVKARMKDSLTRGEAAKIITNFAVNLLDMAPDANITCAFKDMASKDSDMQSFAIASCQLGIMGLKGDGTPADMFNPDQFIDKAQFATMLSRLMYGKANNDTTCWYCKHIEALKADGVIKVDTDLTTALPRGWAMLMLMRLGK